VASRKGIMGSPKHDHRRGNPIERLLRLHPDEIDQAALGELLHELQVHHQELTAQNTQLIETQRALEESRDRFVDLYDFAPIGYMTITTSGIVREINLTGAALLRRGRSNIIGLPFNVFVATPDKARFADHLRQFRRIERSSATVELALKGGTSPTYIQLVTRSRTGDNANTTGLLTALIDITERKRLEQERRDAEETRDRLARDREVARARADAKDHFLATLSHELRTPLTPILATMSDSRLVSLAPEPLLGALQTVRRNLDLEVRLIDDLLDVTRISRDRLVLAKERVDIHQILQEVVQMLGPEIRQRHLHVTTALEAPRHWVMGDPTRLRQVFWNLLGNALKFSNPDGEITVSSAAGSEESIQIAVSDAGAGMDEGVVTSINEHGYFEQGPMTSTSGLGLGLAICRGVISAHKGTLRAMSRGTGRGSTFVVEIPVAANLELWEQPVTRPLPSADADPRPRRILLVEDHQDSADMLAQLLKMHDYEVSLARSMEEAISIADAGSFDLLISDIRLPDGSGLELIHRLRSKRPIRGIAISGFGTEQDLQRSREAGYESHLIKPLDFNRLLDAIEGVHPPAG
jgi:PAS domain S-box-containing protein